MDSFTEDHLKSFMSEEWLAKVDGQNSVPYLFKFHHSSMDLSCVTLVTDTKSVWVEVLNSQQFARRWRSCNPNAPAPFPDQADEDAWRETTLELLSNAHTLGAITDISFEIVNTNFSDLAFELESDQFKWRWETNSVGYRMSAEIISKQLILPLICANHIALSSPDALSTMSDPEVEKAVDKAGRSVRRALDNHVKNALTKPRTSTILRRITALFDFVTNPPPIFSTAEKPDLSVKSVELYSPPHQVQENARPKASGKNVAGPTVGGRSSPSAAARQEASKPVTTPRSPTPPTNRKAESSKGKVPAGGPVVPADGSETEDSDEEENLAVESTAAKEDAVMRSPSPPASSANPSRKVSPVAQQPVATGSDLESASRPASKKKRAAVSSTDDDSDSPKPSQTAGKRGARQPVKRGGKRF